MLILEVGVKAKYRLNFFIENRYKLCLHLKPPALVMLHMRHLQRPFCQKSAGFIENCHLLVCGLMSLVWIS